MPVLIRPDIAYRPKENGMQRNNVRVAVGKPVIWSDFQRVRPMFIFCVYLDV